MKILPFTTKRNGLYYRMLMRTKYKAMYSVRYAPEDDPVGYEVFRIKCSKASERIIDGKIIHYEESELWPSNESFGKTAWSWTTLKKAHEQYEAMK